MQITDYAPQYYEHVVDLAHRTQQVHFHLNWSSFDQWLRRDANIIALAWSRKGRLIGCLALSPPHFQTSWVRLLALPQSDALAVWQALWAHLLPTVQQKLTLVAVMSKYHWMRDIVGCVGFRRTDRVISLICQSPATVHERPISFETKIPTSYDRTEIFAVDCAAFSPLWQMSASDFAVAISRAAFLTGIYLDGQWVGYQLSMRYGHTVHLGRLATLPAYQGRGIGRVLVSDLLRRSVQNGTSLVTVNTQLSNVASRSVYSSFNFQRDYSDMIVYTLQVAPKSP